MFSGKKANKPEDLRVSHFQTNPVVQQLLISRSFFPPTFCQDLAFSKPDRSDVEMWDIDG